MAVSSWDDDELHYGYVLTRPPEGGWWHLHFGRFAASYPCELLGRPTDIVACLTWFAAGVVAKSPQFVMTLDGEGMAMPAGVLPIDMRWCYDANDPEVVHFRQQVVPLLHDSRAFLSAAWEVVRSQRHLRMVAPGWPAEM